MEIDIESAIRSLIGKANETTGIWLSELETALQLQLSDDPQERIKGTQALGVLFDKVRKAVDQLERSH